MSNDVRRARDLLRLAVDPGASEHEARNAAVTAAKLIVKRKMAFSNGTSNEVQLVDKLLRLAVDGGYTSHVRHECVR